MECLALCFNPFVLSYSTCLTNINILFQCAKLTFLYFIYFRQFQSTTISNSIDLTDLQ